MHLAQQAEQAPQINSLVYNPGTRLIKPSYPVTNYGVSSGTEHHSSVTAQGNKHVEKEREREREGEREREYKKRVTDGRVVRAGVTCDMKCTVMIWRWWVRTHFRSNLGCIVAYLNPNQSRNSHPVVQLIWLVGSWLAVWNSGQRCMCKYLL